MGSSRYGLDGIHEGGKEGMIGQRRKWGWGWIVVLIPYTSYFSKHPPDINDYLIRTLTELGGFVFLLVCYFWLRNYLGRWFTDSPYKPAIISGVISTALVVIIIGFLEALF